MLNSTQSNEYDIRVDENQTHNDYKSITQYSQQSFMYKKDAMFYKPFGSSLNTYFSIIMYRTKRDIPQLTFPIDQSVLLAMRNDNGQFNLTEGVPVTSFSLSSVGSVSIRLVTHTADFSVAESLPSPLKEIVNGILFSNILFNYETRRYSYILKQ
jgi:hypothetical protein